MCGPPRFFISSVNCWLMMFIPPWHTWGACRSGVTSFFLLFIIIINIVVIATCGCGHPCLSGLLVNHSWTPFGGGGGGHSVSPSSCMSIHLSVSQSPYTDFRLLVRHFSWLVFESFLIALSYPVLY